MEKMADVLFGSSSSFWIDEYFPLEIQRLGMENRLHNAEDSLDIAEMKFILRLIMGTASIRRRV